MTQNEKFGFKAAPKLDVRAVLEGISYTLLGGLVVSGLFVFVQEIPSMGFVFLIAVSMVLIDVYLAITDKRCEGVD